MSARYSNIKSAIFDGTPLPFAMSAKIRRRAGEIPAAGDCDAFISSVQIAPSAIHAELKIRGTSIAEELSIGQSGELSFQTLPAQDETNPRTITLTGAVLIEIETLYSQTKSAEAVLRFSAESANGQTEPFNAEDTQ